MKKKNIIPVLLLLLAFSCSNNSEDDLTEDISIEDTVTYLVNIKPIIDNNCIICHNNPPVNGAPNALTDFNSVKDAVQNRNLIGRISTNDLSSVMPLGGPRLPQNLIDLIMQWETDGLIEN
ncbi:hypothetical protein [Winogradskyella sp. PE311]|uniref:hypothetical protein n=1 Tax=Winogradskyella sp. PE311 TaxID=3366943 RepID=UPI003980CF33